MTISKFSTVTRTGEYSDRQGAAEGRLRSVLFTRDLSGRKPATQYIGVFLQSGYLKFCLGRLILNRVPLPTELSHSISPFSPSTTAV